MPENQAADYISQEQYDQYTTDWLDLLNNGSAGALPQAFQAPEVARINFLNFSIDQLNALVTAPEVALIKARFLYMPDATGQRRFAATLFALDADNKRLTEYFIPAQVAQTATQPAAPAAGLTTQIPRNLALEWLTDWVAASAVVLALFDISHSFLKGYNFEVSTFKDPLLAAQPWAGKGLFLNFGLHSTPNSPALAKTFDLVVYVDMLGSRTQGTLAGLPDGESFYDSGAPCPPNLMS